MSSVAVSSVLFARCHNISVAGEKARREQEHSIQVDGCDLCCPSLAQAWHIGHETGQLPACLQLLHFMNEKEPLKAASG